jgi:hypothetical protein
MYLVIGYRLPAYNEPRLLRTNYNGPIVFAITEFDCIKISKTRMEQKI